MHNPHIMKSLLYLLILFPTFGYPQFNDCKEHGFKGDIEKVITKYYKGLEKINDEWVLDEDKLTQIRTYHIDKFHNFPVIEFEISYQDSMYHSVMKTNFEDNLKTSFKTYRNGEEIENGVYEWLDDKTYKLTTTREFTYDEAIYKVNDHYRDLHATYTTYYKDNDALKIYSQTTYKNYLDSKDHIILSEIETFKEPDIFEKYVYHIKILEKDEHDNLIKFYVEDDIGQLIDYVERKIVYRK